MKEKQPPKETFDWQNPKVGIWGGVSFEDYVKIDAVNNSTLKYLISQTPAHCKQYIDNGREETPSLLFGSAADCFILEPALFAKKYVCGIDARRNSKEWKEFEASVPDGQIILKPDEFQTVLDIYETVTNSPAMRLLSDGVSQVVCIWNDPSTGLLCKSRWDYYIDRIPMITDLKTTRSADPKSFAKDIFNFGYYQQAAFYIDGWAQVTGESYDCCFAFFAVEKTPPYVNSAFELGAKSIEAGRMAYRKAIKKYAQCVETGVWEGYSDQITMIDMPNWALVAAGFGEGTMR